MIKLNIVNDEGLVTETELHQIPQEELVKLLESMDKMQLVAIVKQLPAELVRLDEEVLYVMYRYFYEKADKELVISLIRSLASIKKDGMKGMAAVSAVCKKDLEKIVALYCRARREIEL